MGTPHCLIPHTHSATGGEFAGVVVPRNRFDSPSEYAELQNVDVEPEVLMAAEIDQDEDEFKEVERLLGLSPSPSLSSKSER